VVQKKWYSKFQCKFTEKNNKQRIIGKIKMKNIYFTTLSLGENYTRDYTCNLIDDVLTKTSHYFAVTTDCPKIITERFGKNKRILIDKIDRSKLKVRLPIGPPKLASDFNFNMRYLCLRQLLELEDSIVIWTDCDNSLDWWEEKEVRDFFDSMVSQGKNFLGPRNEYRWGGFLNDYLTKNNKEHGIFWHKIYNYDLEENPYNGWDDAPLPAEYLLVFLETNEKMKKFYEQFKWFHDYLANKDWTNGTWAEGFELGVSSYVAGYTPYDIGWHHPILARAIKANGHKSPEGKPKHGTEFQ
jgi:hypothetical protein